MLAGHKADAVAWFDDGNTWNSSTAYADTPVPFLAEYIQTHPVSGELGKIWEPFQRAVGVPSFSHPLDGESGEADRAFFTNWKTSPFADEYLARMAAAAVDALELGQGERTDYLAVGFSAPDPIGHAYGPHSLELRDAYMRLDATVGALLDHLDREVGRGEYAVALSSDHGISMSLDRAKERGIEAGRITRAEVVDRVNRALEPVLGAGPYVAGMIHTDLYFVPGVYEELADNREAMKAIMDTLQSTPGVSRVFRKEELLDDVDDGLRDPLARQVAASYFPGRSGEIVVIPKPNWVTWTLDADHGSGYSYDVQVPLILMGKGIKAGRYSKAAEITDIAPTLAHLAGVHLKDVDGRILGEALASPNEEP
jgi:predicted AlkP superfamily pyrophosphatase or phosphodiesterase